MNVFDRLWNFRKWPEWIKYLILNNFYFGIVIGFENPVNILSNDQESYSTFLKDL